MKTLKFDYEIFFTNTQYTTTPGAKFTELFHLRVNFSQSQLGRIRPRLYKKGFALGVGAPKF
jgi:hypothetical protein